MVTRTHVPYRDSKLTQILQPSLSGDARVAVIATMNPSPSAVEETKSTLKFATRVKKVVLKALVKEVVGDKALIHKYQSTVCPHNLAQFGREADQQENLPDFGARGQAQSRRRGRERAVRPLDTLARPAWIEARQGALPLFLRPEGLILTYATLIKAEEDAEVKKLNMNIGDLKSLFLNSGNVGDRRKSVSCNLFHALRMPADAAGSPSSFHQDPSAR